MSKNPLEIPNEDSEDYGPESANSGALYGPDGRAVIHDNLDSPEPKIFDMELYNYRDIEYLGKVFLGAPVSQPAEVVVDTGSNWLVVKACLTNRYCHLGDEALKKKFNKTINEENRMDLRIKAWDEKDHAYDYNLTKSGYTANNKKFPLAYGSANLEGFRYQDFVCLAPMNYTGSEARVP
jgi:hypothetical protein